jgi:succinate dehydrogenase/fumarate reductase cytochrome b subunit
MTTPARRARPSNTMIALRYGLPAAILLAGVLALVFSHSINGVEGLAMGIGVGASVLLLNVLYRVGVTGDLERDEEEAARVYFDEHGRWPDES